MVKKTALVYHRMAPSYDRRWRRYLQETLDRAGQYLEGEGPLRLLDVGCGTGEFIRRMLYRLPEASFVGVDPAFGMLEQARRKFPSDAPEVEFLRAPAEALPFPDGAFDWVTCCNSLHCFPDGEKAVGEMARVLRPEGRLFLMDWCRDSWLCRGLNLWCRWFDPSHVRMYTSDELSRMVLQQGCRVERIDRFRSPGPDGLRLWEMMACAAVKQRSPRVLS